MIHIRVFDTNITYDGMPIITLICTLILFIYLNLLYYEIILFSKKKKNYIVPMVQRHIKGNHIIINTLIKPILTLDSILTFFLKKKKLLY